MEKRCSRCAQAKPVSEFGNDRNRKDGLYPQCKGCRRVAQREQRERHPETQLAYRAAHRDQYLAYMKDWRATNIERVRDADRQHYWANRALHREQRVRRIYGLAGEQYAALVASQGGLCAICRKPPGKRGLHVDHCHATGVVRGLLCSECNIAIGKMKDSPAQLRAAAAYLEERVNGIVSREAV